MGQQNATKYIQDNLLNSQRQETCFLVSQILNRIPDSDISVNNVNISETSITIGSLMVNIIITQENDKISSIEFKRLSFANYDYFTRKDKMSFIVRIEDNLEQMMNIFCDNITAHGFDFLRLQIGMTQLSLVS